MLNFVRMRRKLLAAEETHGWTCLHCFFSSTLSCYTLLPGMLLLEISGLDISLEQHVKLLVSKAASLRHAQIRPDPAYRSKAAKEEAQFASEVC